MTKYRSHRICEEGRQPMKFSFPRHSSPPVCPFVNFIADLNDITEDVKGHPRSRRCDKSARQPPPSFSHEHNSAGSTGLRMFRATHRKSPYLTCSLQHLRSSCDVAEITTFRLIMAQSGDVMVGVSPDKR